MQPMGLMATDIWRNCRVQSDNSVSLHLHLQGIDVNNDALVYVCEGLAVPADAPIVADAMVSMPREALNPGATSPDPTPDQAFSLSSRPGAPNKIW